MTRVILKDTRDLCLPVLKSITNCTLGWGGAERRGKKSDKRECRLKKKGLRDEGWRVGIRGQR